MASNGTTTVCYAPQSGDPNVRDSTAGSSSKKRKSGIGRVFRKLFGRKNVKSQISAPTPTRPERVCIFIFYRTVTDQDRFPMASPTLLSMIATRKQSRSLSAKFPDTVPWGLTPPPRSLISKKISKSRQQRSDNRGHVVELLCPASLGRLQIPWLIPDITSTVKAMSMEAR